MHSPGNDRVRLQDDFIVELVPDKTDGQSAVQLAKGDLIANASFKSDAGNRHS
jgi:hypothetical protein